MKQNRYAYIDALKGFGIILVVIGHVGAPAIIRNTVYSFHMPLFFVLSGFVFSPNSLSIKEFCLKKAKRIIFPYFTFGLLFIMIEQIINGFSVKFLIKQFIALLYGNYIWENNYQYISVPWFLITLFSVSILYIIISNINPKLSFQFGTSLVIMLVGFMLSPLLIMFHLRLPFGLDIAFVAVGFFAFGVLIRNVLPTIKTWSFIVKILLGILCLVIGFIIGLKNNTYVGLHTNQTAVDMLYLRYGIPSLYTLSAMITIMGLLIVFMIIGEHYSFFVLKSIGQRSMLIMILHIKLITVINMIVPLKLHWVILSIALLLISFGLAVLIERFIPFVYIYPQSTK